MTGSITGIDTEGYSVRGNVCGSVCGSVYGVVCGDVHGNVCGGVCGNVGTIDNFCGVCGNVYGTVCGDVCGGVYGDVYDIIGGWYKPLNSTGYTVLTLDQTSGNNVLLNIDVCGKQYYIHAN